MERADAERGPGEGDHATGTPGPRDTAQCPACHRSVEADWHACPYCGAVWGAPAPHPASAESGSALPSVDTGEVAFVPGHGGPRRAITIVEVGPASAAEPTFSLSSLAVHTAEADRIPPEPLPTAARQPVTVVHEVEPDAIVPSPERAQAQSLDAAPPATTLAPTVVVMSPEPVPQRRLDRADIAEIERIVGEAIDRALRQAAALQAPREAALLSATAGAQVSASARVAAVGAGLLVGGALADLLVLNWDVWVRGQLYSSVGWLQQTGIIGMAALAGAGAAGLVLGAARGRRRAARAAKARRPHIPG